MLTQSLLFAVFVLIFMTSEAALGCVVRRQNSRLTDTFIHVFPFLFSLASFLFLSFLTNFSFFKFFFFIISTLAATEQHIRQPG